MNIYQRLGVIQDYITANPEMIKLIDQVWKENIASNPATRNSKFRHLFESRGIPYNKQGYSPSEIHYRAVNDDWEEHFCAVCGKHLDSKRFRTVNCGPKCAANNPTTLQTRIATTQERYGVDNVYQAPAVKEIIKETCLEKYGSEIYQTTEEFKQKFKTTVSKHTDERKAEIHQKKIDTWIKNYGVDHCNRDAGVRQKTQETCLSRYGVDNPTKNEDIRSKTVRTNLEKYGVEYSSQHPEIQAKIKKTVMERHGVESVCQDHEINERAQRKRSRPYTFPSGNTYMIQGYEDIALDMLLADGYTEEMIQLKDRRGIRYFWPSDDGHGDDKWHMYHPDIIIPSENRIIEVKSTWTYDGNGCRPEWLSQNLAKKEGAILANYSFEFWILSRSD